MSADQPVGAVVIVGLDPGALEPQSDEEMATGFEAGSGLTLKKVRRHGVSMYQAVTPGGSAAMFLDRREGLFYSVATRDVGPMRDLSRHLARNL